MKVEVTCPCGATLSVSGSSSWAYSSVDKQVRDFNAEHTVCRIAAANRNRPSTEVAPVEHHDDPAI